MQKRHNSGLVLFALLVWGIATSILLFYCIGEENMNPISFIFTMVPTLCALFGVFICKTL